MDSLWPAVPFRRPNCPCPCAASCCRPCSWARGTASRRSDVDLLVMGLSDKRLLDAYDAVLEALQDCRLPLQPLVARQALLEKHGDSPFWRSVKAEAIPLLEGCRFP